MRRILTLLFLAASLLVPVRAEDTVAQADTAPPPTRGGGGEVRVVITDAREADVYTSVGLVRFAADGALVGALADTWHMANRGATWHFVLGTDLRDASGRVLTETGIVTRLRASAMRRFLGMAASAIRAESGGILIKLDRRDTGLAERLARPQAAFAGLGAFRALKRDTGRIVLVPNAHSVVMARPDTLVLIVEKDPTRGVYLVEAGLADVAPVGEEDLIRLRTTAPQSGMLLAGATRDIHVLLPGAANVAKLLRVAVDRSTIVRLLFGGRGQSLGPSWRPLTEAERRQLPARVTVAAQNPQSTSRRIMLRIVYDLGRAGVNASIIAADATEPATVIYTVLPECEVPATAAPLWSVTPYWLVSHRVRGFTGPRTGCPGALAAERIQ